MSKHKILFILFALPIPISLISWIGTLISVANIGAMKGSVLIRGIALITMLLAGTYTGTYIFSLVKTLKKKEISMVSLLPLLHIALFLIFMYLWSRYE
ncbi:MAG: hypothetical protein FWG36_08030 [Oscillospiraceae bacterium]|nr:hypothetical protein [Oscillospiraceae bacterium]